MKQLLIKLLGAAALLASLSGQAAVLNGTIYNGDFDNDGARDDLLISRVQFSVTAGTSVFFDSLVWESTGVDLNGDGRLTGFDNYMVLLDSNGNVLSSNDDSGSTFDDGSVHNYDSTINYQFANAGTYLITIGQLSYDRLEALQGYDLNRLFDDYSEWDGEDAYGAWRVTMTASGGTLSNVVQLDATAVPEPGSAALLGLGLLGFAASRRKAAKSKNA